jgi:hypothetical protein
MGEEPESGADCFGTGKRQGLHKPEGTAKGRKIVGTNREARSVTHDKRRTPRYPFIATAELIEEQADVRIASRVSELSLHGCYLDMMNPFPEGTRVKLKVYSGNLYFESKAQVIYVQMNIGAGVRFDHILPEHQKVLDQWLDELSKTQAV